MMKNKNLLVCVLPLLVLSISLGCASAPKGSAASESTAASLSSPKAKAVKNNERFEDWKYKGFGMALPDWVEPAIDGKIDKVAKAFSGYSAENIEIVTGRGINVDQSENKISIDSERVLIDGFWVRLNTQNQKIEEPYITVLIYEK